MSAAEDLPSGLNIVGAEALFSQLPPVDWLCQSLRIAAGAPTMFAGYGYSGKSVALQSFALSVASGHPLWGRWGVRQGKVLHLDYEQGRRITSERYQRMVLAMGIDPRSLYGHLDAGILPSVSLDRDILCRAGEGKALVQVDSWRGSHPNVDENTSEVRKSLDAMGVASEKTGATFQLLHHSKKPDKNGNGDGKYSIRGSSGFFDGCQTIFVFNGEEVGAPVVSLEKDRISGGKVAPFRLRIVDTNNGGLDVRAEDAESDVRQVEDYAATVKNILAMVGGKPGTNQTELAHFLRKRPEFIGALVASLIQERKMVKVGSGKYVGLYLPGCEPVAPF